MFPPHLLGVVVAGVGGGQLGVSARVGASLAALAGEEQQGGAEPAAGGPPPHPGHHQE